MSNLVNFNQVNFKLESCQVWYLGLSLASWTQKKVWIFDLEKSRLKRQTLEQKGSIFQKYKKNDFNVHFVPYIQSKQWQVYTEIRSKFILQNIIKCLQ